jgi:protein-disulfide isomerase
MIGTRRKVIALGAASFAGAVLAPIARAADAAPTPAPATIKPPLLGDAKAPKRLVMWGSYTCPFTAMLAFGLKTIVTDLKGAVSLEWRHFPTHAPDPALHVAGLAFQGEHFWGFTFSVLTAVYKANGAFAGLTPELLAEFAKAQGGSAKTLQAAYADKAKWTAVKQDLMAGKLLGVTRTPGLFYNGYFLTPDGIPRDLKAFDKSLREMLAHA